MSDIMSAYEAAYGLAEKVFLRTLGGNPDEIARRVDDTEAQSSDAPAFVGFSFAETTPAEDLHNEIIKDIQQRYFAAMPRETALAIGNALCELGEFTPCATIPALKYTSSGLVDAWNTANPDKEPIKFNAAAYFAI